MPYEIKKVRTPKNSYKVCKKIENKECYSKRGLPYKRALAQLRAIIISEKTYQSKGSKKVSKKVSKKPVKKQSKRMSKRMSKRVSKVKPARK
jgi:hypothetical protein